jgi:hypothetical protein
LDFSPVWRLGLKSCTPVSWNNVSQTEQQARRVRELTHFVKGRPVGGTGDRYGDIFNPAPGEKGVRSYTRYQSVLQRWPHNISKGAEFIMPVAK